MVEGISTLWLVLACLGRGMWGQGDSRMGDVGPRQLEQLQDTIYHFFVLLVPWPASSEPRQYVKS